MPKRNEGAEPRHRILDKLNEIALRVYGPGDHGPYGSGAGRMNPQAEEWYQQVQEHFSIEKDEHGNEYLYHRDDSPEGPRPGTSHN